LLGRNTLNLVNCFNLGLYVIIPSLAFALPFPQDFGFPQRFNYLIDAGLCWESNSLFHPLSLQPDNISNTTTYSISPKLYRQLMLFSDRYNSIISDTTEHGWIIGQGGIEARGQTGPDRLYTKTAISPFIWGKAGFKRNWYADFVLRSSNEARSLDHYTGITRDIARAGFNTAEFDRLALGYKNDWANVEFGRGREIIGPMAEDNLAVSGGAPAFERLVLQAHCRRYAYRYFYGFLESLSDSGRNIQRYIVGKTLEYNNHHNLVIGLTELSILAGWERSIDWAFLNPLALHIEVEQNERDNQTTNDENALWVFNLDWLALKNLRLAGALLMDDFQLDAADRKKAQDQLGYQLHIGWTIIRHPVVLTALVDYVSIGTFTTQHNHRWTNFVSRGKYLGNSIGNDADLIQIGARLIFRQPVVVEMSFGQRRWGDNSLLIEPYRVRSTPVYKSFPSGQVRTNRFFEVLVDSQPMKNLAVRINGHIDLSHKGLDSEMECWTFMLRYAHLFVI